MDLWKGYELSRTYVPAAYYTITSIKSKNGRANPLTRCSVERHTLFTWRSESVALSSICPIMTTGIIAYIHLLFWILLRGETAKTQLLSKQQIRSIS